MSYNPNPTVVQGNEVKSSVTNVTTEELLYQILFEIKLTNKYLAELTEEEISLNEIEEELI